MVAIVTAAALMLDVFVVVVVVVAVAVVVDLVVVVIAFGATSPTVVPGAGLPCLLPCAMVVLAAATISECVVLTVVEHEVAVVFADGELVQHY